MKNVFSWKKIFCYHFTKYTEKNYLIYRNTFTYKLLENVTIDYKETASIEINVKFWSRMTEIVFSCEMSSNLCFIYNFDFFNTVY